MPKRQVQLKDHAKTSLETDFTLLFLLTRLFIFQEFSIFSYLLR